MPGCRRSRRIALRRLKRPEIARPVTEAGSQVSESSIPNPLNGLSRPPGQPALIRQMAHEQHNKATHLNEAATDLGSDARSVTAGWTGNASVAFAAHASALCDSLTVVAESHGAASTALDTWADALQAAQTAYDEAVDEAALAVKQEREAAEQAQQLLPSLAPDAGSPVPRVASPLRSIARQDAEAAIAYARQAAQRCAAALRALVPDPPVPAATPHPTGRHHGLVSSIAHSVLDVAGLIPVVGEPADGANAAWYAAQGDHLNAGLSAAGMVPFLGWGATGTKFGLKGARAAEKAEHLGETARHAERWADAAHAGRAADAAADAARAVPGPRPATLGHTDDFNYRRTYFTAHPDAAGKVVVHHAVEQQALTKYPGLFTANELHSLENLRGIPHGINNDVHLSKIRRAWDSFYLDHLTVTREEILAKATEIDALYGPKYLPPHR